MSRKTKKRKRRPRSRAKRVKLAQKRNPVSRELYKKRLRKARMFDFLRHFFQVVIVLAVLVIIAYFAGNSYLKKETGQGLAEIIQEAKETVESSEADDFKYAEPSFIYSSSGSLLATLSSESEDATYLEYDEIPEDVINAFVAVEDQTFWENQGYDAKGIVRAVVSYVTSGGSTEQGASTITQQLARTEYLSREKVLSRKVKEIFIARELTQKYSKEQIIEFYVNTCCFANGIYGIEDASKEYFGVSADELSVSQIAYLCAIPNRPEYYNPYNDSSTAITRRDKILADMYECGYITESAYEEAVAEEITIVEEEEETTTYNYETTYAIDCAVRYIMELNGFDFQYEFSDDDAYEEYQTLYDEEYDTAKHDLYTGGYTIYTTIDMKAQKKLQKILNENLSFEESKKESGIYEFQGAMTVIDNETHKVVAIIGGRSQKKLANQYSLNRAYQSYRQPGSTFKPLAVYTPALEDGYTGSSTLVNIDVSTAKNSTSAEIDKMSGSKMSLNSAVIKSINGCAYWLFNQITPAYGLSFISEMQFSHVCPSDYTLSAALGGLTHGVTTVEMANAYSTLENHGEYTEADCIDDIIDSEGNSIYTEPESKTVYTADAADSMTDILMGVIKSGTASSMSWSSSSDTDAAGKTGTTNDSKDGWFCGYTPYYTIAVWVGYDTPQTLSSLYGATYPAQIWKEAMLYMIDGLDAAEFDITKYYSSKAYTSTDDEEEEEEEEEEETTEKKNNKNSKSDSSNDSTDSTTNESETTEEEIGGNVDSDTSTDTTTDAETNGTTE